MANEIVKSFGEELTDKLVSVETALPKDFNRERFVQNCLAVLNEKPELAKINKAHLQLGLLKGAYLGLDFMNKEIYMIPYGSSVQVQTSYIGEQKFVKKYSIRPIKDITSNVVREGDVFSADIIENVPVITFKPVPFNDKPIVGVFAIVYFEDGGILHEVMSTKEVNEVRNNYSKMKNSSPWQKSWSEMARKTVLRRLCKHIETDFESAEARKSWEETGDCQFDNTVKKPVASNEVVDVFAVDSEIVEVEE